MNKLWRFFASTSPRIGYMFIGVAEAFWGLWYLNPLLVGLIDRASIPYFDPPTTLGVFAVILGITTVYANLKSMEFGKSLFGMIHIAFWSYVMISLGFEHVASAGIPLAAILLALSMFLYILQQLEEK